MSGFERLLVVSSSNTSELRVGRISQRLLELETYRIMALRGLPVAKDLVPMLGEAEAQLARITARMENKDTSDQELLDQLIALAAHVCDSVEHQFGVVLEHEVRFMGRSGETWLDEVLA